MEGDVSLHQDFLKETDAVLTHEMIATQTNVGFIKEIIEKVKFIKDVISRNNLKILLYSQILMLKLEKN